jgi:hypothetical protein
MDEDQSRSRESAKGTAVHVFYFILVGVLVLSYFLGWIVVAIFAVLWMLAWVLAWWDDRRQIHLPVVDEFGAPGADREADPHVDADGRCRHCGNTGFAVTPGVTTAEAIRSFAAKAPGWKDNPEALAGWMPPGLYCPNGCFSLHVTPSPIFDTPVSTPSAPSELTTIPRPLRITLADVMRDGGSYVLVYEAEGNLSVEVMLRVIIEHGSSGDMRRIGYERPTLSVDRSESAAPIRELDWDEARELARHLRPLAATNDILTGSRSRAAEMLRYLSLKGKL